jgi:glycosyltransferase involved in cell wall biosynthesis
MQNSSKPTTPPWASFCLSTRRRPEFLTGTLKSIQRQTFGDFEVIIADNDPGQSARAIVDALNDTRFCYFPNEADIGMIPSFNRSLARATGEFVVMITDDDPIYPEMLEVVKRLSEQHPGYGSYFGGADMLQLKPEVAGLTLHRVGTNSCLAPLPYGAVRTYSEQAFPHAFFSGEIGTYMLWSVGAVRRDIAQSVRVPDYGSPYLGDHAYTALTCSRAGCVITNRALGCQTVHDFNFGRKECGEMKAAVLGFTSHLAQEFSRRSDWPELKPKVERYAAQWIVLHALFLKQYFKLFRIEDDNLKTVVRELFQIPFIRGLRPMYYLGYLFWRFQRFQAGLRQTGLRRMQRAR